MEPLQMRIAVASDIHAYDPVTPAPPSPPSYLCISDPADQPSRHPIAGLKQLIANEKLKADVLICPGDMADKANTAALSYVWNELHNLKTLLGADRLIATAGNHDVDSRHKYNDFDAKGALQALLPPFPGLSEQQCDRYWARNFVLLEEDRWRLLLLNSSAYHGSGKDPVKEAQQGRVSDRTMSAIESALANSDKKELNVLLCHHHLYRDNAIHEADYSEMEGADHLIRLLGSGEYGQWLVVHGHKHHPKLQYGAGGLISPVVFGAGSLCASLYAELAARARNQFYILDIDPAAANQYNLDVAGKIRAWDWIPNAGFKPAGIDSGLPHMTGFGYRATVTAIASRIAALFSAKVPYLRWSELVNSLPELDYLLYTDIGAVLHHLKSVHAINSIRDSRGAILELAKA
jgi:predicted phosphodiesterase